MSSAHLDTIDALTWAAYRAITDATGGHVPTTDSPQWIQDLWDVYRRLDQIGNRERYPRARPEVRDDTTSAAHVRGSSPRRASEEGHDDQS